MPTVQYGGRGRQSAQWDRGRCVFLPVRYADDFVVLVSGTQEDAVAEKAALADYLRQTTGLELSPEKTKVTAITDGFEFLGFRFVMQWDKRYGYGPRVEIPKAKAVDLRRKVKRQRGKPIIRRLGHKLQELNPILRGWANYYRYCAYAGRVFTSLDWYIGMRIERWLRKKRPKARPREIWARQSAQCATDKAGLAGGSGRAHMLGWTPVCRYRLAWMGTPDFATSSGEPGA